MAGSGRTRPHTAGPLRSNNANPLRPRTSQGFRKDPSPLSRPGTAASGAITERVKSAFTHGYKGIKLGPSARRSQTARPRFDSRDRTGAQAGDSEIELTKDQIHKIFMAKCKDLGLQYSLPREKRFTELMNRLGKGTTLNMSENGLGPLAGCAIANALAYNSHFLHLKLTNNLIRDKGAMRLAKALERNTTLLTISLQSNDIGADGGEALFDALCHNSTLTSIDISALSGINRNHIGQKGALALGRCLKANQVLMSIGVNQNGIGSEGAAALAQGIRGNRSLVKLDLSGNNLGIDGAADFCHALPSTNITHLNLSRNNIGDIGMGYLADAITVYDKLVNLDVSFNNIGPEGVEALSSVIAKGRNTVATLNLSHNQIGASGALSLATALRLDQCLKSLSIAHNDIQGGGLDGFGKALVDNLIITKLDISNNLFRDAGALGIAAMLEGRSPLAWVDMSTNKIKDEGGLALARALRINSKIRHLNLRNNMFHDPTGNGLAKALATNDTITFIDIEYNDINYQNFSFIEKAVANNAKAYKDGTVSRLGKVVEGLAPAEQALATSSRALVSEKVGLKEAQAQEKRANERLADFVMTHDAGSNALLEQLTQVQDAILRKEQEVDAKTKANADYKANAEMKCSGLGSQLTREVDKRNLYEKKIMTKERELQEYLAEIEEIEAKAKAELATAEDAAQVVISASELDIARLEKLEATIAEAQHAKDGDGSGRKSPGPTSPGSGGVKRPTSARRPPSAKGRTTSGKGKGAGASPKLGRASSNTGRPTSAKRSTRPTSSKGKGRGTGSTTSTASAKSGSKAPRPASRTASKENVSAASDQPRVLKSGGDSTNSIGAASEGSNALDLVENDSGPERGMTQSASKQSVGSGDGSRPPSRLSQG